ncbi:hypothetical protein K144316041_p21240 (plasmid) [Clostridium tetani]|uniref:hypothetical protein n=1 Tax=Clostridium tetani TaxID=1513 RepID=UPI002953E761|nr:hypothetical protein [Clostridium tetani]BDR74285.1 hypothetical protein K144316041_p21240 [Clostridium tetani]
MSVYEPIIEDICSKCGEKVYSEGVNNGVGYVYPPFHCGCGWSESCGYAEEENCKRCDQYEMCYNQLES